MRSNLKRPKNKAFLGLAVLVGLCLFVAGPQPVPKGGSATESIWMFTPKSQVPKPNLSKISPQCTMASHTFSVPQSSPVGGYLWPRSSFEASHVQMGVMLLGAAPHQIAIVSAEILLVNRHLAQTIQKRFATLGIETTLFTATHTHSGPGGFGDTGLEKIVLGQDRELETRLVTALAQALQKALNKSVQPMFLAQAHTNVLLRRTQSTEKLDDRIGLILCGTDELWVMHAAHPVTEKEDQRIHGDWPQLLTETMKNQGFSEVLYASSSGGEVSLARPKGRAHTVKRMAKKIKRAMSQKIRLDGFIHLFEQEMSVPHLTVPISPNWALYGPLTRWLFPTPAQAHVQILQHPRMDWFFLPYESSAALWGPYLQKHGMDNFVFHTPFNGDYLGYIVPQKRYGQPGPEQLLSLLGIDAAVQHEKMLSVYFKKKEKRNQSATAISPE